MPARVRSAEEGLGAKSLRAGLVLAGSRAAWQAICQAWPRSRQRSRSGRLLPWTQQKVRPRGARGTPNVAWAMDAHQQTMTRRKPLPIQSSHCVVRITYDSDARRRAGGFLLRNVPSGTQRIRAADQTRGTTDARATYVANHHARGQQHARPRLDSRLPQHL